MPQARSQLTHVPILVTLGRLEVARDSRGVFVGGTGSHAFYFLDPDGNRIEVYCWMMTVTGPSMAAPRPDL